MESKFGCNRELCCFLFCALFCVSFNVFAMEGQGAKDLINAAYRGDVQVVEQLLAHKGINVNQVNTFRQTALMLAALDGQAQVVELLLARKDIDVNQTDGFGETALMSAASCGHAQVVELLLAHKDINVNQTNKHGETALTLASGRHHYRIVFMLQNHEGMHKAPITKSCFVTFTQDDHNGAIVRSFMQALVQQTIAISRAYILKKILLDHPEVLTFFKTKRWTLFLNASNTICVVVPDTIQDVTELNGKYGFSINNLRKIDSGDIEIVLNSLHEGSAGAFAVYNFRSEPTIKEFSKIIDQNSPQRPTRFLLSGHGAEGWFIADIPVRSFGVLLNMLAEIGAEFLYVYSCETAGTNLLAIQKQISVIIEDNLRKNLKEAAASLKPVKLDYTIVVQASSDVSTRGLPNISGMFTQLGDFYKQTSPEGLRQQRQQGAKRLTMNEIIKNAVPKDSTALASIRFPGTTTFFRAADLGDMKIITALDVQKEKMKMPLEIIKLKQYGESLKTLEEKKAYKSKKEQAEIQQTIDDIKEAMQQIRQSSKESKELVIPIASNIRYIQMFPCGLLGFTLELQGKNIPMFISKIPGGAQHFIGKITYTSSQSTPTVAIEEFIGNGFAGALSGFVLKSNKCWFIKSLVLNVCGVQELFKNVAIFIEATRGAAEQSTSYMYYYQNKYVGEGPKAAKAAEEFKDTVRSWAKQCQPSKEALIEATAGHEGLDTCAQALKQFLD